MSETHCPHCGRALDEQAVDVIDRATALLKSGMTGRAAAQELGLTPERLSYLMARAGTPVKSFKPPAGNIRPGSSDPERTKAMIELRRAGWTYRQIGERFDVRSDRARKIVAAHSP